MKEFCLVCFKILLFSVVYVSPACCLKAHDHHCAPAVASLLLQFKNHFNITESASDFCEIFQLQAVKKLSWEEGSDCCKWEGVSCDLSTGHVIGLDLSCGGLDGSIHPNSTLFQLHHLQTLNLARNDFSSGSLPGAIGSLTALTHLNISDSDLSGIIPSEISQLSKKFSIATGLQKLWSLDLSRNALNGTIPPWVFSLPSLSILDLSKNQCTGKLPQVSSNSSLKIVDLSNNQIDGLIPRSISNLLKATVLNFASNNFSGNIPPCLFSLPSLFILDLSKNHFTGKLPEISSKSSLEIVDLSNNQLDGWIPHSVFLNIANLSVLNLHSNQLQGSLTIAVCNSSALEFLILKNNKFNGTIPQCLGELDQLSVLDLGMNNFNSIVPTMFAKGKRLTTINLNGNQLRGPIPTSLVNCTQLEVLDLGNNKLKDTFPEWLGDLMELRVLVLKSNRLYGPITSSNSTIWFPNLQIFDLSCNGFTGALPKYFFSGFKSMTINVTHDDSQKDPSYLKIASNLGLSYNISIGLVMKGNEVQLERVLTILITIDLSNNQLQGEIPTLIGNLNSLILLNLSRNCFNGSIPHQIGNLTSLQSLDISWNQLAGKIPEQITNLIFLEVLNLSQNHLVGQIPRSNQFNTFENNSYGGNLDLCGFPMSRECNDQQQHAEQEDDKSDFLSGFTWRSVLIGYCCGAVIGIFIENLMSRTGRPKWFVTFCGTKIRKPVPRRRRNA